MRYAGKEKARKKEMKKPIFKLASEQADGMTKEKIKQILLLTKVLDANIDHVSVEPWVLEHITTAHDDLLEVASYFRQLTESKKTLN